ncbi:MAG TPA: signal peptidase II [Solirubrobacterales bacterium]|nr:signal peptidase II [Solirubrobacterales bacterium]
MTAPAARAWWLAAALCLLVVILDQVAKAVIEAQLTVGEQVDVLGPLGLTLSHNRGVAFGIAGGAGAPLIVVTLGALCVVLYLFSRNPARPGMWIAAGLLAGGAIGNLIDRVRLDEVTDFIDISAWPPFNLADVAITCGVVLLVWIYLREAERQEPKRADG